MGKLDGLRWFRRQRLPDGVSDRRDDKVGLRFLNEERVFRSVGLMEVLPQDYADPRSWSQPLEPTDKEFGMPHGFPVKGSKNDRVSPVDGKLSDFCGFRPSWLK